MTSRTGKISMLRPARRLMAALMMCAGATAGLVPLDAAAQDMPPVPPAKPDRTVAQPPAGLPPAGLPGAEDYGPPDAGGDPVVAGDLADLARQMAVREGPAFDPCPVPDNITRDTDGRGWSVVSATTRDGHTIGFRMSLDYTLSNALDVADDGLCMGVEGHIHALVTWEWREQLLKLDFADLPRAMAGLRARVLAGGRARVNDALPQPQLSVALEGMQIETPVVSGLEAADAQRLVDGQMQITPVPPMQQTLQFRVSDDLVIGIEVALDPFITREAWMIHGPDRGAVLNMLWHHVATGLALAMREHGGDDIAGALPVIRNSAFLYANDAAAAEGILLRDMVVKGYSERRFRAGPGAARSEASQPAGPAPR